MDHGGRRQGAGRPSELDEPKTLAFRVDRSVAEAAEEAAMMRGQSLSEWLRDLVVTATQARKREPRNVRIARTLNLERARGA